MISIVICSRHPKIDVFLEKNIKETIGDVQYEIVWIDNSNNRYSIFEAYNEGVSRSNGKYICFMHEDVIYWSIGWGNRILCEFAEDKTIGMLGLIGSHLMTRFSFGWLTNQKCRGMIRQGYGRGKNYRVETFCVTESDDKDRNVVVVDGLWMVIRKDLFDSIKFDVKTYEGFHFYDMDICMQILQRGYKIIIVDKIDVEHKSSGNADFQYFQNCILFHKKWDAYLPVASSPVSQESMGKYESSLMEFYFHCMGAYKEQKKMLNSIIHKIATKLYLICKKGL